ncbi:MAG: sigma-70 family RNA polymerase sigma factor [Roseivirga sp.]|nr:sigma-70 family RNA polymerase sigma factor [Roseivirga sp.]
MLKIELINRHREDTIVDGLRSGKKKTLNRIYKEYFPVIKDHILKNSGSVDDAKDVFQDAMMAIFQTVTDKDFELTCQFKTYLYSVSAKIWKKRLRDHRPTDLHTTSKIEQIAQEEIDDAVMKMERYKFYRKKFTELSEKCQQLLKMFLNGMDTKRITENLGFASIAYTKKRKYQCKEGLIRLIEQDPEYQLLVSHD